MTALLNKTQRVLGIPGVANAAKRDQASRPGTCLHGEKYGGEKVGRGQVTDSADVESDIEGG